MNKEEILRRARSDNNGVDEVAQSVERKANSISQSVGLFACALLYFLDSVFLHTTIIGSVSCFLYFAMTSTRFWVIGIQLKKPSLIILAIFDTVLATAFLILFVIFVIKKG